MSARRQVSSELSAKVIDWLRTERHLTQDEIAERLEVSPGFISRVRAGERSLTVDHFVALAQSLGVPLGALLLAASPIQTRDPKLAKLSALAEAAIRNGDLAAAAIRKAKKSAATAL